MSTLRSSGDRIDNGNLLPVFAHGAYNLGSIIEYIELETTAVHPGERVDWGTGAGGEDTVIESADASIHYPGVSGLDLGMVAGCSTDYALGDEIPVIIFHWNPGALLRNIQCVDPAAAIEVGEIIGSTSGTAGSFKDDTTTGTHLRAGKYFADGGVALLITAYIFG